MATIATYDFQDHDQGDTFPGVIFALTDGNSDPIPLDDVLIELRLFPDGEVAMDNDDVGGITVLSDSSGDDGRFMIDEQIIDWKPRTYKYEMVFTFGNGKVKTYIEGHWKIID
jgi:hypothetical protein